MSADNKIDPLLIDIPMPIYTRRLMLRPPQAGDGAVLHETKRASWPELNKWMMWTRIPLDKVTVDDDEQFCRNKQVLFLSRKDITVLIFDRENGMHLGGAGLHRCDWDNKFFTLGYWIRSSETKKGYATEVAKALSYYAFKELQANKIIVFHAEGNIASQRVIEKAGFEREGILKKQHAMPDGSFKDEYTYGLLDAKILGSPDVTWGKED